MLKQLKHPGTSPKHTVFKRLHPLCAMLIVSPQNSCPPEISECDLIWSYTIFVDIIIMIRSYWIRVGPSSMTCVCPYKKNLWTYRHAQSKGDMKTHRENATQRQRHKEMQGRPATTRSYERGMVQILLLRSSILLTPCFGLLDSNTVTE